MGSSSSKRNQTSKLIHLSTNRSGLPVLSACRPIEAGCQLSQCPAVDQQERADFCNFQPKNSGGGGVGDVCYTRPSFVVAIKYKQVSVAFRVKLSQHNASPSPTSSKGWIVWVHIILVQGSIDKREYDPRKNLRGLYIQGNMHFHITHTQVSYRQSVMRNKRGMEDA